MRQANNQVGLLSGIRVLDFGRYIAGPYCAALLGDMGAEVIRIEKRDGSEDRFIQPMIPGAAAGDGGEGAVYLQMNRNKLGMTLDPMTEGGREITRRLVAQSDIVVANLPPSTLKSMGLDYEALCAIRPDIILTTVSAFGHGGPYSERTGFDAVAQSMCGAAYLSGYPEEPVRSYASWVDFGTASLSAFGTLAALMERARSGCGQMVEGALLATALTFFNPHLIEQKIRKVDRIATGNRSPIAGPADIIRTKDGWILLQALGQPLFRRWVKLMKEDYWLSDPRFRDDSARGDNGAVLSERTARWAAERDTAQALRELEEARIPAGPVYSPQQALDDPHIRQMGWFNPMPFPGVDAPVPLMETPVRLSRTPGALRQRAPLLGEHTDEILKELGYSEAEINTFEAAGAI